MPEILCVDDEPGVVELVELILQSESIKVRGAHNGVQALKAMREKRPDAVLLDIMMPEMDGWDVFKAMKADAALRDIPVLILTARNVPLEEIIARERAGVDDYITKPFTPAKLRTSVHQALARREQPEG